MEPSPIQQPFPRLIVPASQIIWNPPYNPGYPIFKSPIPATLHGPDGSIITSGYLFPMMSPTPDEEQVEHPPMTGLEIDIGQRLTQRDGIPNLTHRGLTVPQNSPVEPIFSPENELFIGNIPPLICRDMIISLFGEIGRIYQFRMKAQSPGQCSRIGFIQYYEAADASRAIEIMNGYKFLGHHSTDENGLCVKKARNNTTLHIHNIPKDLNGPKIMEILFARNIPGMVDLVNVNCPKAKGTRGNRGYCFVQFKSNGSASLVLHSLSRNPTILFHPQPVKVNWAFAWRRKRK